jgi:Kef-type K+ transport system membrane component KefB
VDTNSVYFIAAAWLALALVASVISIRVGVSVALVEIAVGVAGGNYLHLHTVPFIDFLAGFGSVLLTFLAGAEIDPDALRRHIKPALTIGAVSFSFPFVAALLVARFIVGWDLHASEITGVALSTTSVAIVYAVMVETGLNRTDLGKLILAACFVTDLGTVVALGVLFADFNGWLLLFIAVTGVTLVFLPRALRFVIANVGGRVSEPEIKFIFVVLLFLGWLAQDANSEAVLPAYLVGLVVAGVFVHDQVLVARMRSIAFSLLTPFYFLKAGLYISLPAVVSGAGLIALFLLVKLVAKAIGVWPTARGFRMRRQESAYLTLLMSTGLTFGSIAALFGLTNKLITQSQYTILITVVILSGVVPTIIAQALFRPDLESAQQALNLDQQGGSDDALPEGTASGVAS